MSAAALPGGPHAQCHTCQLVVFLPEGALEMDPGTALGCPRCGATVHRRKPDSIARTWAFLIAALICYLPANLLPIMTITSLGSTTSDTILSGVLRLVEYEMYPVAFIIFVASGVVPILKIVLLAVLASSVQLRSQRRPKQRTRIYRYVDMIGRWSMVDVYVVTILVALVKLGAVATVEARAGALFFGAVVVLTLWAAESFDPRLIWDGLEETWNER